MTPNPACCTPDTPIEDVVGCGQHDLRRAFRWSRRRPRRPGRRRDRSRHRRAADRAWPGRAERHGRDVHDAAGDVVAARRQGQRRHRDDAGRIRFAACRSSTPMASSAASSRRPTWRAGRRRSRRATSCATSPNRSDSDSLIRPDQMLAMRRDRSSVSGVTVRPVRPACITATPTARARAAASTDSGDGSPVSIARQQARRGPSAGAWSRRPCTPPGRWRPVRDSRCNAGCRRAPAPPTRRCRRGCGRRAQTRSHWNTK